MDPLAAIVHRDSAFRVGKALVKRLKELIPRQQFKIPLQAAIGSRVIASEGISGVLSRNFLEILSNFFDVSLNPLFFSSPLPTCEGITGVLWQNLPENFLDIALPLCFSPPLPDSEGIRDVISRNVLEISLMGSNPLCFSPLFSSLLSCTNPISGFLCVYVAA